MPTITKRKLLEKALALAPRTRDPVSGILLPSPFVGSTNWYNGVIAGARAAGVKVIEGPELPERIGLLNEGDPAFTPIIDLATGKLVPDADWPKLKHELIRRYNAKAKVLEVAGSLDRSAQAGARWARAMQEVTASTPTVDDDIYSDLATRLRAAYEESE